MACITLLDIDEQSMACAEQDNMGGIVPRVIFGYHGDVDVWPSENSTTSTGSGGAASQSATNAAPTMEQAGALGGDLVMADGKRAFCFDFTDEMGSFSIAPQGEKGSISYLYTLTIVNKRIRKLVLGFLNAVKNRKMFFIVQDSNGTYYLMGDARRGAMLAAGDGAVTGSAATDSNQVSITFEYVSPKAKVYEGDVEDLLEIASS